MNRYKNKALNLQRKIREMEFANKKPINILNNNVFS